LDKSGNGVAAMQHRRGPALLSSSDSPMTAARAVQLQVRTGRAVQAGLLESELRLTFLAAAD